VILATRFQLKKILGENTMKRSFLSLLLVAVFCGPGDTVAQETIKVEGTVQRLLSTCGSETVTQREKVIIAAIGNPIVLVDLEVEDGYYLLPNINTSLLRSYLDELIKVTGTPTLEGTSIQVERAEVLDKGEWVTFWSPDTGEITKVTKERSRKKKLRPGSRRRTRKLLCGPN
jgi:hypothetical protein